MRIQRTVVTTPGSSRRFGPVYGGEVVKVHTGNVFSIRTAENGIQHLRILGVEAPLPSESSGYAAECYAQEAKNLLTSRILGKDIRLVREQAYNRDSRGLLVRYAYLGGSDVGAWMIRRGGAFADQDPEQPRSRYYTELQYDALKDKQGLWSYRCDYNDRTDEYFELLEVREVDVQD